MSRCKDLVLILCFWEFSILHFGCCCCWLLTIALALPSLCNRSLISPPAVLESATDRLSWHTPHPLYNWAATIDNPRSFYFLVTVPPVQVIPPSLLFIILKGLPDTRRGVWAAYCSRGWSLVLPPSWSIFVFSNLNQFEMQYTTI